MIALLLAKERKVRTRPSVQSSDELKVTSKKVESTLRVTFHFPPSTRRCFAVAEDGSG